MHDALFQPLQMGALHAKNRIHMAPLTRGRAAEPMFTPNALMATYYRQRAGAGMILTEATGISREGLGWPSAPGIWSDEQTEAWKATTKAVHEEGGLIVMQLWHMGRIVHPVFLDGQPPFSASATTAPGEAHTPTGKQPYAQAREMTHEDIKRTIADYRRAAENAKKAGFDGVQLHSANGYLVDQFLRSSTNLRTDDYGGSAKNRARFLREVLTALIEVNINNLAAVPSIVFGLLGAALYLNFLGMPRSAPLVGGLVLALMVIPFTASVSAAPSILDTTFTS